MKMLTKPETIRVRKQVDINSENGRIYMPHTHARGRYMTTGRYVLTFSVICEKGKNEH